MKVAHYPISGLLATKEESTMKTNGIVTPKWFFVRIVSALLTFWLSALPTLGGAQTIDNPPMGDNAVWLNTTTIQGTPAFIDASAWCGGICDHQDPCDVVHQALKALPSSTGGVVDARGVVPSTGGAQDCFNKHDPFAGITAASTVLLPPSTIQIHVPWNLPSNTRISGQGRQTVLRASTDFELVSNINNAMIAMGTSAGSTSVVVEHLKLDGTVQATGGESLGVSGIYNNNAQDGSYVDDVSLFNLGAVPSQSGSPLTTGLLIDVGAVGSGPYSKITFSGSANCSCGMKCNYTCVPTACAQIRAQTRGLHGITCSGGSTQQTGQSPQSKTKPELKSADRSVTKSVFMTVASVTIGAPYGVAPTPLHARMPKHRVEILHCASYWRCTAARN
jgi:hypothetical protein